MAVNEFIQNFSSLPPFCNDSEVTTIERSILNTFESIGFKQSPHFCCYTINSIFNENKEWDRMLYICDGRMPVIAFFSVLPPGDDYIFVDSYGNIFPNEIQLLKSVFCKTYFKYYNVNKVFNIIPYESSEEYLKDLVKNMKFFYRLKIPKLMEMFIESYQIENSFKIFKKLKAIYLFFFEIARNFYWITEFQRTPQLEIIQIKFFEIEREKEIIIEVNLEKLSNGPSFKIFAREMWRIANEAMDLAIEEESITEMLSTAGFPNFDERYVITMNRNFGEDQDLMSTCTSIADRISEKIFQRRLTLSQFKNIVLWVRERLFNDYETVEEIIQEYQYLHSQISKFKFKEHKYSSFPSAAFHIYKHFDDTMNNEIFKNYKNNYLPPEFMEKTEIFAELIKTQNNEKILFDCFYFFFIAAPLKLFKKENLVYWHFSSPYQAYTFALENFVGSQFKIGSTSFLSIATMYSMLPDKINHDE